MALLLGYGAAAVNPYLAFETIAAMVLKGQIPGKKVVANQLLYNLERRGIERSVLPWCHRQEILVMAYSPLEQGRLDRRTALREIAERHGATPAQIALVWTLRHDGIVAIPKAGRPEHVRENAAAAASDARED